MYGWAGLGRDLGGTWAGLLALMYVRTRWAAKS